MAFGIWNIKIYALRKGSKWNGGAAGGILPTTFPPVIFHDPTCPTRFSPISLHKECLCVVYTEQFEYFMDKIRFRLPFVQYVH